MVTITDVRYEIQKRLDSVSCVDDERDTLLSLRDYIDEGRGFEPVVEHVTRYRVEPVLDDLLARRDPDIDGPDEDAWYEHEDTESLEDTIPDEMLALEREVGL